MRIATPTRLLLVLALGLLWLPAASAQEYSVIRNVRMHTQASAWSLTLRTLRRGEKLFARHHLSQEGRYLPVRMRDGTYGWAYAPYLQRIHDMEADTISTTPPWPGGDGTLGIHFLSVGQGDATLLVCPNDKRILVDAGSLPYPKPPRVAAIRNELRALLDATDKRIDTLVVTHPDGDHYGLLPEVLRDVAVDRVVIGGALSRYVDTSWDEHEHGGGSWLRTLNAAGKLVELAVDHHDPTDTPSDYFDCGDAKIFIVAASVRLNSVPPAYQQGSVANGQSVVLMIRYKEFEVLLTGDATYPTEYKILEWYGSEPNWLEVDVLKIGHHGSSNGSTHPRFVAATQPRTAIASAGKRNGHGHPRKVIIKALEPHTEDGAKPHLMSWKGKTGPNSQLRWEDEDSYSDSIYSTGATGTISVYSDGDEWWLEE